ncbi:DNA-directed RNA polymerase I, II, and III 15kDa polypeptide (nucleomorph) [Lotharella oceanica]|uniref:DNA-directed RNA polymerase I, II, and III 15kDa polypeptide n=1 Tax=Lotharella oceanica TaxID=641309 RepID=A0A060DG97_9EUKA|nr:DNA-directed RNA polymerase I, II, and III 15kDa polypeptide [Lotharella oceanica]
MKNYYLKIFSDIETDTIDVNKKIITRKLNHKTFHNFLTKFEKTRIIGIRALQISHGSMIYVQLEGESDSIQIAIKEFREKKIPFKIRRFYPDGSYIDYKINEFYDTLDF